MPPPWHYAFVVLWAVIPLGILLVALVGTVFFIRRSTKDQGFGWLMLISLIVPLAALSTGKSMVYDGERLFMPASPSSLCSGCGITTIASVKTTTPNVAKSISMIVDTSMTASIAAATMGANTRDAFPANSHKPLARPKCFWGQSSPWRE
jgi:hypothetical protein